MSCALGLELTDDTDPGMLRPPKGNCTVPVRCYEEAGGPALAGCSCHESCQTCGYRCAVDDVDAVLGAYVLSLFSRAEGPIRVRARVRARVTLTLTLRVRVGWGEG